MYYYNKMNPNAGINVIIFLLPSTRIRLTAEGNHSLASQHTLLRLSHEEEANSGPNASQLTVSYPGYSRREETSVECKKREIIRSKHANYT